jgi:5,5'-dehydrodivanillate O-demethylase
VDEASNRTFSQVGAGTPMGELMRRYWHPVAAIAELDDHPTKAVRLLGEDLVVYKDLSGNYGLLDRHCAHRRSDMSYGFVEEVGLRCNYHGWLYDHSGRCIGQPFEDMVDPQMRLRERIRIKSYKVEPRAGLLWAYLGPDPVPLLPNWEPFTWKNGFVQIVFSEVPCNWFQCQENSIDPVHFEWMHDNWSVRLKGNQGPYSPKHLKVDFEEFDYGIQYKRIREGADETHPLWTIGRVCLWPHALFTGNHFEWRVPIDDATTLSVGWFFSRVPKDREPYVQKRIPYWTSPVKDPQTGRWITSHVMNQDFVAWVGQGTIADRTQENLGRSDRGIAMMRRRFLVDLETIAKGGDPKAVIRDEKLRDCVPLPIAARKELTEGLDREYLAKTMPRSTLGGTGMRDFVWLIGQPEEVKKEYREAMGWELK